MSPDTLQILRQAVEENLAKVQQNATAEHLKNWRASVRELEEAEAEFTGDGGPDRIKGIPAVVRYLDGKGWKISSSTAYHHRDSNRMPGPDKEGYFAAQGLDIYAREYLKRKDGGDADESGQGAQSEKQQASAEKEKQQAENWRIRNEILKGKYVEKSFMEREFSSRSAFLRTDLNTFWEVHALTIIELTGGDPAKVPALVEKGQDWVRDWTDRYARAVKYPEPKAVGGEPGE
jgi:hypothetical protein